MILQRVLQRIQILIQLIQPDLALNILPIEHIDLRPAPVRLLGFDLYPVVQLLQLALQVLFGLPHPLDHLVALLDLVELFVPLLLQLLDDSLLLVELQVVVLGLQDQRLHSFFFILDVLVLFHR